MGTMQNSLFFWSLDSRVKWPTINTLHFGWGRRSRTVEAAKECQFGVRFSGIKDTDLLVVRSQRNPEHSQCHCSQWTILVCTTLCCPHQSLPIFQQVTRKCQKTTHKGIDLVCPEVRRDGGNCWRDVLKKVGILCAAADWVSLRKEGKGSTSAGLARRLRLTAMV